MRTLETTALIAPEGYYVYNVTLTALGRAKLYKAWLAAEGCPGKFDDYVLDIEADSVGAEMAPAVQFDDGYEIHFIADIDYVVEYASFESFRLAKLARELEEFHAVMQEEMVRLGW